MPRAAPPALEIHTGATARRVLLEQGLRPQLFDVLVGASGGPKWLVLEALDRRLFPWLLERGSVPLRCIGSSIGAWRHLCLAQPDPVAAIARFGEAYLEQAYENDTTAHTVSAVSRGILAQLLGAGGARAVSLNPGVQTHIVTARAKPPWRRRGKVALAAASVATAGLNAVSRSAIGLLLERWCFHTAQQASALRLGRLPTRYAALDAANLADVALASASIPLVAAGVDTLREGEVFWDGGMTDYHFEPDFGNEGLTLYPHFYPHLTPGWFDKPLRWRRTLASRWPNLVLVAPSAAFVATLPRGRIPDRHDFVSLSTRERQRLWRQVMAQGEHLADAFDDWRHGDGLQRALECRRPD